jgi:hypothetical protein
MEKHFKDLDRVNFWNNNNEQIIVYVKKDVNIEAIYPDLFLNAILKMPEYKMSLDVCLHHLI